MTSSPPIFLLTRFAISPDSELKGFTAQNNRSQLFLDPEWLERRLGLFQEFCLPSVNGQSDKNFLWLIAVDARVPADFVGRLSQVVGESGSIIVIRTNQRFSLNAAMGPTQTPLEHVTIRLDSDDSIARDFVAKVRKHSRLGMVLNFPVGAEYIPVRHTIVRRVIPSNPFISYYSSSAEDVMSFESHSRLPRSLRVSNKWTYRPMYLRVNHNLNTARYKQTGAPFWMPRRISGLFSLDFSRSEFPLLSSFSMGISYCGALIYRALPKFGIVLVWLKRHAIRILRKPRS